MQAIAIFIMGVVCLVGFLVILPLIQDASGDANLTTNITEYEGASELIGIAPWLLFFVFIILIVIAMFGGRIKDKIPLFGDRD